MAVFYDIEFIDLSILFPSAEDPVLLTKLNL